MQSVFDGVHVPPRSRQRRSIAPSAAPSRSVKGESTPPTTLSPPPPDGRQGKRKRGQDEDDNGRTPKIKLEEDDEKIKLEPEIESRNRQDAPTPAQQYEAIVDEKKPTLEQLLERQENFVEWPIPEGFDADTFCPLDPAVLDAPSLCATGPDVDSLKALEMFHYHVFRKGTAGTFHSARDPEYSTDLGAYLGNLNVGATEPGKPFLLTTGIESYAYYDLMPKTAVAVKVGKRKGGENWKAFGLYELAWNGRLKAGQYVQLDEGTKEQVRTVLKEYLKRADEFSKFVFDDCYREDENGHLVNIADMPLEEQDEYLEWCLVNNLQINMYWSIMRYIGPNEEEVEDWKRHRNWRYGDPRTPEPEVVVDDLPRRRSTRNR